MTILGFLLTVCYVPGWTGFAIPTGWVLLSVVLPLVWRHVPLNPFLAYACITAVWAPIGVQAGWDLWILWILSWAFALGREVETGGLFVGMAAGVGVSSVIAIAQAFGWNELFQVGSRPAGLFVNGNVLGEVAALVSVGVLAQGARWPLVCTLPALLLSGSRLSLAVLAVVGCLMWRTPLAAAILASAAGVGVIAAASKHYPLSETLKERLAIWADTSEGLTFSGSGLGSFITLYPSLAKRTDTMLTRPADAHNDFLQLVFQYGIGTLLLVPALWAGLFGPLGPERYVFIAFCVIAFFSFPLAVPAEGFLGVFCLGRLYALRVVDGRQRSGLGPVGQRWVRQWQTQ